MMIEAPSVQIQGYPCPKCGGCDFYCAECYDAWEELMAEEGDVKEELHIVYKIERNQDQELDVALKALVKKHGWYWCNTSFNYATGERGLDFDREELTEKGSGTLVVRMPGND